MLVFNRSSNSLRSQTREGVVPPPPPPLCREGWRNGECRRGLWQPAYDLQVWVRWLHPFDLQGRANFFASLYAAACAICHLPPVGSWQAPSSFRRFGASNGAMPVPIGPVVRPLFLKMLEHTYQRHSSTIDQGLTSSCRRFRSKLPINRAIMASWALITNIKSVFECILLFKDYSLRHFWHLSWRDSMLLHFFRTEAKNK